MAFEQRATRDYFSTALLSAATAASTTMQSVDFVGLDTDYGTNGKYLPLVLHDDTLGVYEVVWVTAHASNSNTVTVVRGKEGTTALAWGAGTRVEAAPTSYDILLARTAGTLPSDAAIGTRVNRGDKKDSVVRVNNGWAPEAGVAFASDVGPGMTGVAVPDGAVLLMRCQYVPAFNTGSTGVATINFKTPFPNACLMAWPVSVDYNHVGPYVIQSLTAASVTLCVFNGSNVRAQQNGVSLLLAAIGY